MVEGDWKAQTESINSKIVLLFGRKLTEAKKLKGIADVLLTVLFCCTLFGVLTVMGSGAALLSA